MRIPIAILLLLLPGALSAQTLRGRVIAAETDRPITHATLELLDDRNRVRVETAADSTGAFRIRGWQPGKYRLRVRALGYTTVTSDFFELGTGEEFALTVRLAVDALPLEPIKVVSRSRSSLAEIALRGYYDRRDSGRRIGMGRFLDRGEIAGRGARKLTDVLRTVSGLRVMNSDSGLVVVVRSNQGGTGRIDSPSPLCPVSFYLDGMPLSTGGPVAIDIDQTVPVDWVEAIEVYRRPAELPAEFLLSGACGVVAVWTRRG